MNKPHIIYIFSDEHRGQAMSHTGDPNVRTPAMDRLAHEGASFERAYTNCPICTPARGTVFSGRHAHAGPVAGFFDTYKVNGPSTATVLAEHGYHSAYLGKWHCGTVRNQVPPLVREHPDEYKGSRERTPERHRAGFRDWYGFENLNQHFDSFYYHNDDVNPTKTPGYETDGLTNLAMQYIDGYDRDQPLFMVLSVTPPHFPLIVPEKWKRFDPETLTVRPNFSGDTPGMREHLANYYAMIENLDWNIGRLAEKIRGKPGWEDTLIVYFSDHGDFMGSHDRANLKEHPHEESVRIPAVFSWPENIPAQGRLPQMFSLVDLLPTTLGLLGIGPPEYCQGIDFSPALRGEPFSGPETVLCEMVLNPRWNLDLLDWRGIVTREWKYAFYENGDELLFNLDTDPYEMKNLAETNREKCDEMRQRLLETLEETREPYFDVIIEHGVPQEKPDIDVSRAAIPDRPE